VRIDWSRVPLLPGVHAGALGGAVTGASGRNWQGYGAEVALSASLDPLAQTLLTDPQTSGGLLVSCAPECVGQVLDVFLRMGFGQACEVGEVVAAQTTSAPLQVY
jgi:selenide,water dikinase